MTRKQPEIGLFRRSYARHIVQSLNDTAPESLSQPSSFVRLSPRLRAPPGDDQPSLARDLRLVDEEAGSAGAALF